MGWVVKYFLGKREQTWGRALSTLHKMKIFLRFITDPDFQNGIGKEVGIHQCTVSHMVSHLLNCIMSQVDVWIKVPKTYKKIMQAKEQWFMKNKCPTSIGAVDCTQVHIQKSGYEYIKRKYVPLLNVQVTCNQNYIFTSIDIRQPREGGQSIILAFGKTPKFERLCSELKIHFCLETANMGQSHG